MSGEQDFWARRKAKVEVESLAEQASVEQLALAEQHAALEEKTDAELLEELDLPDPDTMEMGDDFSVFMSKTVPDRIRRRALRTLWRSNPVLANVDMLVDYGDDFTDAAMAVENIQTAYQVGKGMLKHVQEMARQAEERENPAEPVGLEEEVEEEAETVMAVSEDDAEYAEAVEVYSELEEEHVELLSPSPRRMKFVTVENAA
ncbi:DUF3306 domain-containing protein [uncultured Planktomarina sp.]|uniref:DUF3306 domain-containing protein n=1 Tax=uncultured Planktomarina sp. TaxID=1538529 RepID=UPI0032601BE2